MNATNNEQNNASDDSWSTFSDKRFFGTDDVRDGSIVQVIASIERETLEKDGEDQDVTVCRFKGDKRGLILKANHKAVLREEFGKPSQCVGKAIEMYFDKDVSFGGKRTGGLRIRAAKEGAAAAKGGAPF